jgi:hypothetical protein
MKNRIFWVEILTGRDRLDDLGVDRNMILNWILRKQGERVWIGLIWLRIKTVVGILRTR